MNVLYSENVLPTVSSLDHVSYPIKPCLNWDVYNSWEFIWKEQHGARTSDIQCLIHGGKMLLKLSSESGSDNDANFTTKKLKSPNKHTLVEREKYGQLKTTNKMSDAHLTTYIQLNRNQLAWGDQISH